MFALLGKKGVQPEKIITQLGLGSLLCCGFGRLLVSSVCGHHLRIGTGSYGYEVHYHMAPW